MRIAPTLEGGLRLDLEQPLDWLVLRSIITDARQSGTSAAERAAGEMADQEDWRDFVMPELAEAFGGQLTVVEKSLRSLQPATGIAELFITPQEADAWYGALNQARLALEDRYSLSGLELEELEGEKKSAWFRSQFYCNLQTLLIERVMRSSGR
jgi:hypothetical protein